MQKRRVILETHDGLASGHRVDRRADGSHGFNDARVHAAMDDAVGLAMLRPNLALGDHFVGSRAEEMQPHGLIPPAESVVHR
jgi:hypothetical protein